MHDPRDKKLLGRHPASSMTARCSPCDAYIGTEMLGETKPAHRHRAKRLQSALIHTTKTKSSLRRHPYVPFVPWHPPPSTTLAIGALCAGVGPNLRPACVCHGG